MWQEMHVLTRTTLFIVLAGLVSSRSTVSDLDGLRLVTGSRQLRQSTSWNFCNKAAGTDAMTAQGIAWTCTTCDYKAPVIVNDQRQCRMACLKDDGCKCAMFKSTGSIHGGHQCQMLNVDCDSDALGLWRPEQPTEHDALAPCRWAPQGGALKKQVSLKLVTTPRCNSRPPGFTGPGNGGRVGVILSFPVGGVTNECVCENGLNGVPAWSCASVPPLHNILIDYNQWQVQASGVDMSITLASGGPSGNGSRLRYTWAARSAWFCADVQTPPGATPGAIFSLYASSGEPTYRNTEKWDELDFEFLLKEPNQMWLNTWHDGQVVPGQEGYQSIWYAANAAIHRYCLDWDLPTQTAKWTIDGKLFRTYKMQGWTKPMIPYMSFWGQSGTWAGYSDFSSSVTVHVKNIAYKIRG